jgi:hypothetical protein
MAAIYKPSHDGIGDLLRAPFMQAEMLRRAQNVEAAARAAAPDATPLGVGYKYEFETTSGVKTSKKGTRRAYGRVTNHSDHALAVEYGFAETPKYRTLGRALDAAGD